MINRAGERLFEAIGQLPDEMILEAERDGLEDLGQVAEEKNVQRLEEAADHMETEDKKVLKMRKTPRQRTKEWVEKLGGYLKYIPVAACLCLVLGGGFYVLHDFKGMKDSASFSIGDMSGAADGSAEMGISEEESEESKDEITTDMDAGSATGAMLLPVRYDAYEGPVFPMTATGDTQKLKTNRSLKAVVTEEKNETGVQPVLHITDRYQIKNTSEEDKALQIVYPFAATLNLSYQMDGDILQAFGENDTYQTPVTYSFGDSIRAYSSKGMSEKCSAADYEELFTEKSDYQEHALEKAADWNREVSVYTFSDIRTEEDFLKRQGVIGVTVYGTRADVLTYGFDYSSETDEGMTNHCFFLPQDDRQQIRLIVTGEQEKEPKLDFYANLDCDETVDGIQCEMTKEEMSYADALYLCSNEAARQLAQDYEQKVYEGELPEYMNGDAVFKALTVIDEEESFYRTLTQRYQSAELKEIFNQLFGETRMVYALTTVTIPAKQSVQIIARTQKLQNNGHFMLMDTKTDDENRDEYQYDFLSTAQSHLSIKKTKLRLELPAGWEVGRDNIDLAKQKKTVWNTTLSESSGYLTVKSD